MLFPIWLLVAGAANWLMSASLCRLQLMSRVDLNSRGHGGDLPTAETGGIPKSPGNNDGQFWSLLRKLPGPVLGKIGSAMLMGYPTWDRVKPLVSRPPELLLSSELL